MTKKNVRKTLQRTKSTPNIVKTQEKINRDYRMLFRDYGRLSLRIWEKPVTRYIVGGAALAALFPIGKRAMSFYPRFAEFFRGSLDEVESRLSGLGNRMKIKDDVASRHH